MSYGERRWGAPPTPLLKPKPQYVPPTSYTPPTSVPKGVSGSEQLQMEEQYVNEFNEQVAAEERKARDAFERALMEQVKDLSAMQMLAPQVRAWMKGEKQNFESGLKEWKAEQKWEFDKSVSQWRYEYYKAKREYHPSITEMMLGWTAPVFELGRIPLAHIPTDKGVLKVEFDIGKFLSTGAEATVAAGAGFVGGMESFIYPVLGLAGWKTPAPPPTISGAVIQTGISSIIAGEIKPSPQFEEMQKMKYPVTYAASTVLSDVILGYVIGKGVEKAIVQPTAKLFKHSRLETYLIGRGIKIKEGVPIIKGYWAKRAAKELAPQIVSIPRLPEKVGMELVKRAPAVKGAWEMMLAPKTAGLLITPAKAVTPTAVKVLPRLTAIGVMGAQPFVQYAMPPQPPVKMKPLMDIMREPTGFQRYKWTMPVTKEGMFIKGKLPSLKDLLKEFAKAKKGQVMLPQLITLPKKIVTTLPKLPSVLGLTGASPLAGQILGATGFLGVKLLPSPIFAPAILKAPVKLKAMQIPSLSDLLGLTPVELAKEEQVISPVQATILEQVQIPVLDPLQIITPSFKIPILPPPPTLKPPPPTRRREEEELRRRRIKRKGVASIIFGRREYEFPTTPPRGVSAYVFGRRK